MAHYLLKYSDEIGEHLSLEPELDPLDEMDPLTEEVLLDAYEDLFDAS